MQPNSILLAFPPVKLHYLVMTAHTPKKSSFETSMSELEKLVDKIETGNLSLEESLKQFEKGVKLSRICQSALTEAEQRVKILTDSLQGDTEEDFHLSD